MPLPTSLPDTPATVFDKILNTAQGVLGHVAAVRSVIGSPQNVENLVALYNTLHDSMVFGQGAQAMPGLSDYAKQMMADPSYDIVAAFTETVTAGHAVTEWLLANLPSDGQGGFVSFRVQEDGSIKRVQFDASALAPMLDDLLVALKG